MLHQIIKDWLKKRGRHFRVSDTQPGGLGGHSILCECKWYYAYLIITIRPTSIVATGVNYDNRVEVQAADPQFFDRLDEMLRRFCPMAMYGT